MSLSREEVVGRVAAGQHGLITRAQALAAGYDKASIYRACKAGRWRAVARGVYQIVGAPWTWHTTVLRECLARDGIASHRTGAVFLRAGGFRPGPVEITVRTASKDHDAGARVHEALDFDLIQPIVIGSIPVTPPARLGVDLGSVVSYARYEATMDELIGRGDVTWEELAEHLETHARRGRNGVGTLRKYLDARMGSLVDATGLEQRLLRELRRRGFPEPTTQLVINDRFGVFLARVDVAYEPERVILEADSLEWHLNRRSLTKDPTVRRRLRMLGWFVLEITHDMLVDDADATFADLRRLLHRRRPDPDATAPVRPAPDTPLAEPRAPAPPAAEAASAPRDRSEAGAAPRVSIIDELERAFDLRSSQTAHPDPGSAGAGTRMRD
jgi:very-short-patch-repair endonuclease